MCIIILQHLWHMKYNICSMVREHEHMDHASASIPLIFILNSFKDLVMFVASSLFITLRTMLAYMCSCSQVPTINGFVNAVIRYQISLLSFSRASLNSGTDSPGQISSHFGMFSLFCLYFIIFNKQKIVNVYVWISIFLEFSKIFVYIKNIL